MRRNIMPIKNNRLQAPTSTQLSIIAHINKMSQMMAPSHRPIPKPTPTSTSIPSIQLNCNIEINIGNNADSDEDYFDDYIMNDSQSQESQESDDSYFVPAVQERFDKDRGATYGEIGTLPVVKLERKVQGVCSICLEEWRLREMLAVLPCAHKFHNQCIKDWLSQKNKCPCCNSAVFQ